MPLLGRTQRGLAHSRVAAITGEPNEIQRIVAQRHQKDHDAALPIVPATDDVDRRMEGERDAFDSLAGEPSIAGASLIHAD